MGDHSKYTFRRAIVSDLTCLNAWRQTAPVAEWWDDDFEADDLNDPRVAPWIVSLDHPFAYIQDYDVHGWADHYFAHLPPGSRGIDQFIGVPDMLNQGHGATFIAMHVGHLFEAGAPMVATDPDPRNARAIAAYEKVGFKVSGPPKDTKWGRILPMTITPAHLRIPGSPGGV